MSDQTKQNDVKLPPGEEDLQGRVKGLEKELIPLLGKYELGLGAQPGLTQDGKIGARAMFVSTRKPKEEKQEAQPETKLDNPDV